MNNKIDLDVEELVQALQLSGESPDHFLVFITATGNDRNSKEYKRLNFLIKSKRDIAEWFTHYNGNIEDIREATDKFKKSKLKNLNLSMDKFLVECVNNLKAGLEYLFQEECSNETSEKIREKLHSEELTLSQIYKTVKTNEWYTSANKIARANWN